MWKNMERFKYGDFVMEQKSGIIEKQQNNKNTTPTSGETLAFDRLRVIAYPCL